MTEIAEKINLNDLSDTEKQNLYRAAYKRTGVFSEIFGSEQREFECLDYSNKFRSLIENMLIEKNIVSEHIELENLHQYLDAPMRAYNFNDGVNKISSYFYETNMAFQHVYHDFIKNFIYGYLVKDDFYFQATPTLRLHCPDAENSNHYPRFHTDIGYGHPAEEINIWIPLTKFQDTHGFKVMNLRNSKDILESYQYNFHQFIDDAINSTSFNKQCATNSVNVTCPFGSALFFDSRCVHSGEPLLSYSRVSMDVRIIRVKDYHASTIEYRGAGRRKILFSPGQCYNTLSASQL